MLSQTIQNEAGKVTYNIDQTGRQNEISVTPAGGSAQTAILNFNNNEQQTAIGLPNNVEQDAGYTAANQLSSLTAVNNAYHAALNTSYTYGYDPMALTTSITTTVQGTPSTQTLTHDAAGRLTAVSGGASSGSWRYDGRGNLSSATVDGVTTSYSYNASNPEEVAGTTTSGQPTTSYGYDAAGDTTNIQGGSKNVQIAYDAQQRPVQITLGSPVTETITLSYNAFGQRASYTVTPAGKAASLVETFKYQGDQLSQVSTSGSSIGTPYSDSYVYTQDGAPLELLRQTQGAHSATPYWYVLDGQGNVTALTDSGGNVVDSYSYDQWGRPLSISQSVPQQLRYNGYWYDSELGWYWLSVRHYDPVLARFLQPDPSELEGLFSYVYAGDSPSDAADPSGLISQPLTAGCLLTGNNNFEHNVAVGSAQWVAETTSGGSKDIGPSCELGALLGLVPSHCSASALICQMALRAYRAAFGVGPDCRPDACGPGGRVSHGGNAGPVVPPGILLGGVLLGAGVVFGAGIPFGTLTTVAASSPLGAWLIRTFHLKAVAGKIAVKFTIHNTNLAYMIAQDAVSANPGDRANAEAAIAIQTLFGPSAVTGYQVGVDAGIPGSSAVEPVTDFDILTPGGPISVTTSPSGKVRQTIIMAQFLPPGTPVLLYTPGVVYSEASARQIQAGIGTHPLWITNDEEEFLRDVYRLLTRQY